MTAIQRDHKLSSYSLNWVSQHFLKVPMPTAASHGMLQGIMATDTFSLTS